MARVSRNSGGSWGDIYNLLQALAYSLLGFANLRAGATGTNIRVDAFGYRIGGQVYTNAAEEVSVTGLTNTSATQFRKVRVEIAAAGTLLFSEGAPATAQALARIPRRVASRATVGWIEIPASFTYGTTAFTASGVTFYSGDPDLGTGAGVPPNDRGITAEVIT